MTGELVQQRAWLRRNLVNRLFRLGNAVQAQTQQLLGMTSDLGVVHYRILLRLCQAGSQNVQGIAELLGANRSVVSRALPAMKDAGWLEVVPHERDRRQLIVKITPKGQQVVETHRGVIDARFDALNAAFSDEEFERLLEYLDRLDAIMALDASNFTLSEDEEEGELS